MNRRKGIIIALAVILLLFGILFINLPKKPTTISSNSPKKIPVVNDAGVEKQVAEKLQRLRVDLQQDDNSAAKWGLLGMNLHIHGFKEQAIECYQQAANLDPKEFRWPYFCAIILDENEPVKSGAWFERARKIRPDYTPLLVRVGESQLNQGQREVARTEFQHAVHLDPNCSHALLGLAQISLSENRLQESQAFLDQALKVNPKHSEARVLLATVRKLQNQPGIQDSLPRVTQENTPLVDEVYASLVAEGVSSYWYRVRGRICMEHLNFQQAEEEFRNALKAKPDAEAYNNLGAAMDKLGKLEEAVSLYQKSIELQPTALAFCNLGSAFGKLKRYPESIDASSHAIQLKPDYAQAYFNIAVAHFNSERWRDAIQAIQQTIRLQPDHAQAHYLLTQCYLVLNDRISARREFETLRKLDPKLAERLQAQF